MITFQKQYISMSFSCLFAGDIKAASEWYYKAFGYQILSMTNQTATLQVVPGRIMLLSTDKSSPRSIGFVSKDVAAIHNHLVEVGIEEPQIKQTKAWRYFNLKDLNDNELQVWEGGFLMNRINHYPSPEMEWNIPRFYLDTQEETKYVATLIDSPEKFNIVSETLVEFCTKEGVQAGGDVIYLSRHSGKEAAVYAAMPVKAEPTGQLPEGVEFVVVPDTECTVFPIHKSKQDDSRTSLIQECIKISGEHFSRPEQFYVVENNDGTEYIQVFIPYTTFSA